MLWSLVIFIWTKMASVYPGRQTAATFLFQGSGVGTEERSSSLSKGPTVCTSNCATRSSNVAISQMAMPDPQPSQTACKSGPHSCTFLSSRVMRKKPQFCQVSVLHKWLTQGIFGWENKSKGLIKGYLKEAKEITKPICKSHTGNE